MAKQKTSWKKHFTTVTPLSKTIALILFILLPFIGFYLGVQYQKTLDTATRYFQTSISQYRGK